MRITRTLIPAVLVCLLATACGSVKNNKTITVNAPTPGPSVNVKLPGENVDDVHHSFAGQHPEGNVNYIVDGQQYSSEITTEEDITTLYIKILGFAKLGHNVSITAKGNNPQGKKTDVHTYSSTSETEVATWAARMVRKGYSVTIEYNKSERTYTCTAYKKK